MSKYKKSLLIYLKGLGMGGADVVPGVSGGTIAFITGIYEELLDSIKAVDLDALKLLLKFNIKEFWKKINGNFLLPLFLGIITSLATLSKIILYLLENHPIPIWSFFFGLIIISAILVLREVKEWKAGVFVSLILGIIIAYIITGATPAETPTAPWFIFISGAIAICAMILPGISGSFILLVLGKYEYIFKALSNLDITTILIFIAGCVTGLLSFVRVISWLLKKYHNLAISLLAGFMLGSLNKVWPWKIPTAYRVNHDGEQVVSFTKNVLPTEYLEHFNKDPQILISIIFLAVGIFVVVLIEKVANYKVKPAQ
ncbi:DUF368 domain-containing protein [Fulvivirga maritima]|uniref:DUF368 domain-containing protein n=1 Tax=Fulvivirga maritima TaxID=2904247 RepID=UPI001F1A00B8|nr:DUF368 domain-containing protein [Fulvivirga maritima]UII27309.1 DUF368 domain-containing protein [Fulvivirga maritima]